MRQLFESIENVSRSKKYLDEMSFFSFHHYHAILFRKYIIIKRTWKSLLLTMIFSGFVSCFSILIEKSISSLDNKIPQPYTFKSLNQLPTQLIFLNDSNISDFSRFVKIVSNLFFEETHQNISILYFESISELNDFSYQSTLERNGGFHFGASLTLEENKYFSESYFLKLYYNNSYRFQVESGVVESIGTNALWKYVLGEENGFSHSNINLQSKLVGFKFSKGRCAIIICGFSIFIPFIISQSINDLYSETLVYMKSNGLKTFSYWLASFTIDFLIWILQVTIVFLFYIVFGISPIINNGYYFYYSLIMTGPSLLLFCYCFIFCLSSPTNAPRQIFIAINSMMIIQVVIEMIYTKFCPPLFEDIISAFLPPISTYSSVYLSQTIDFINKYESFLWEKDNWHQRYVLHFWMQYVNIFVYSVLLTLIEKYSTYFVTVFEKRQYKKYAKYFIQNNHNNNHNFTQNEQNDSNEENSLNLNQENINTVNTSITKEAAEMEEMVRNSHDFSVRVEQVSRLFFDNHHQPITAVNNVSLGVRKNHLFGFLGANGAGKTTLIKMITGMLPISDGNIEIESININDLSDRSIICVCPQFNDHLIPEMTVLEHFTLYSLIYGQNQKESRILIREMIDRLDLSSILHQKVRDICFGDSRKLAIALCFFGPAKVILLDEPTTSLYSNTRKQVHTLILEKKETKTILLCTHLLHEADFLCDEISIMIKGRICTVDTPQNLTQKFGTSIKIDILLTNSSFDTNEKCSNFMTHFLPTAKLVISRPNSRIYKISNKDITFPELFNILEQGQTGDHGIVYFTCTSSSLEQTFLEIIKLAEQGDVEGSVSLLKFASTE
ncbi:ABC transporter family protein [Tritrichomonas foetus]|uniref:ABC transporter family protein n=1 Tax=Tritrichomonas foetus TaxID=1144522 RepID=A0A1J4KRW8_9EUKA|nr:ABC transporter family protein [Tritrichomonas foetus]|eukprot:OHT12564.1 ABC transporter family protein [Tritrichomonas foetus]